MTRQADLRASDADREQVAERLRQATTEGRLLPEEFEDRLGAALSARTYGELAAVVADLPAPGTTIAGRSRAPARRIKPTIGVAIAVLAVTIGIVAGLVGGHFHAGHSGPNGFQGGASVFWIVWIAIAWRFYIHRRGRAR
jgi:hypothetical protein